MNEVIEKKFDPEFKVKLIREHIDNQVGLEELCLRYSIEIDLISQWKKELFEGAAVIFSTEKKEPADDMENKLRTLERKIKQKERLILELERDNFELKRMLCSINDEFDSDDL